MITNHRAGVLPCPPNPPPPDGWVYWLGPVPTHAQQLANEVETAQTKFRMGSFVQAFVDGKLIGARVEWHGYQGSSGNYGCYRGTSLFRPTTPVLTPGLGPNTSVVRRATPGKAVDTSAKLDATTIKEVRKAGYSCVIRYVPHQGSSGLGDIDGSELKAILNEGLALLLVQHVRNPNWQPANCSGTADGSLAAKFAEDAGYLHGAHIFVDLEGINGSSADTKKYAEDWADAVVERGFLAGAYIGYQVPMTPDQLYLLRNITSYWSDAGPRHVSTRGFAIKQYAQTLIGKTKFDPDVIQVDLKGETPVWMSSAHQVLNA